MTQNKITINQKEILNKFECYVNRYNLADKQIHLKVEHSYKVSKLCETIALYIENADCDPALAWLIGLLHDIGRFEQLRRFHTFQDSLSLDHAALGVDLLFSDGLIRHFIQESDYDDIIRNSIICHSAYSIPSNFSNQDKLYATILRDADKLDILRVCATTPIDILLGCSEDDLIKSDISPIVIDTFNKHKSIENKDKHTPLDFRIGHISLAYELEFAVSRNIMLKQGWLKKLVEETFPKGNANREFTMLIEEMNRYLEITI